MSPRGDHGVCENCSKPGHLALFRLPTPMGGGFSATYAGPMPIYAIVLCVGCAEKSCMPRWFDSVPIVATAVRV